MPFRVRCQTPGADPSIFRVYPLSTRLKAVRYDDSRRSVVPLPYCRLLFDSIVARRGRKSLFCEAGMEPKIRRNVKRESELAGNENYFSGL